MKIEPSIRQTRQDFGYASEGRGFRDEDLKDVFLRFRDEDLRDILRG